VSLIGAGPGDPGLMTMRACARLAEADVVLYDGLVPSAVRRLSGAGARRVSVARRVGAKARSHQSVIDLMIAGARAGQRIVRLKSGDPLIFGRGGEEAAALSAAGVPFEIVPGVSTALAAPALAGIPVTHRGVSSGVVVISGHAPEAYRPVLDRLRPGSVTVVVMMGLGERVRIARGLIASGWRRDTPAAVIVNASRPRQQVWTGTLASLGRRDPVSTRERPGVIVIGDVVTHRAPTEASSVRLQRSEE
jgi:uroporphyrin-III C-methyltransferase/precorrin-2 dehydrogenase/sirohydrochlorin ferrochelatase